MTTTSQAPRCPLRKGHLFVMCGGSMRCSCCGEPFLAELGVPMTSGSRTAGVTIRVRPWPRDLGPMVERLTALLRDPATQPLDRRLAEEAARMLLQRLEDQGA